VTKLQLDDKSCKLSLSRSWLVRQARLAVDEKKLQESSLNRKRVGKEE